MIYDLIFRLYEEWRPKEGWLPLFLIIAIGSSVITAVREANWVPEDAVVTWTVSISLALSVVLAKRSMSWLPASILIAGYGVAVTVIILAQLRPPVGTLAAGPESVLTYIRQNLILFGDRAGGWLQAVSNQESSQETIVFALGLGLISWLLIAYLSWATFRQHNPFNGLIVIGLALGFDILYGRAEVWTLAVFIGLAVVLMAAIHMIDMQQLWERRQIDYPTGINVELLMAGGGVALGLLAFSFVIPAINIRAVRQVFMEQPSVQEAEQALERAFSGVNINPDLTLERELERSGGRIGDMPRSFLLGNPPELAERLVMTATVQAEEAAEGANWPIHWRAFSYDIYTGRGWSVSSERTEDFAAGEPLPLPPIDSPRILSQMVHWALSSARTRYTMGLPLRFDQFVTAHWRGLEDLSQVRGGGSIYSAESQVSNATPNDLQQAALSDIPDAIIARYTALPDDVPERVYTLAQEAVGNANTPYEQVKAIERFLRQYPYSLDVTLPPTRRDLVDYFLFDLQTGYCDYYASAMVVMVRSLGIPARFATGFLAQTPDENGMQQIFAINAHSWAEVYFAGYGWVEFEPTAAFPTQSQLGDAPNFLTEPPDFLNLEPIELPPPQEPAPPSVLTNRYFLLVLVLFLAAIGVMVWLAVGRQVEPDSVLSAYGRLQRSANRIGQPTPKSQTPIEFGAAFTQQINKLAKQSQLAGRLIKQRPAPTKKNAALPEEATRLTELFMTRQYRRQDGEADTADDSHAANLVWQRIRVRLWLLAVVSKIGRFFRIGAS